MKWQGRRGSSNIEDRRRTSGRSRAGGLRIGGFGLVAVVLLGWVFGVDVTPLLTQQGGAPAGRPQPVTAADEQAAQFASVTLADTEAVWAEVFRSQLSEPYRPPVLVLFKGATDSPCGGAQAATGPFYCPLDRKAYLDTDFFVTLSRQLGAEGDFAAAYVVAHEVAHHVQNELGILEQANRIRAQVGRSQSNEISVRIELQADCLAGIWARYAQERLGTIEPGDLDEAINAARRIGDDTLQRNAGQRVAPHTFTHGTSAQRARWFQTGFQSGSLQACDTFGATQL